MRVFALLACVGFVILTPSLASASPGCDAANSGAFNNAIAAGSSSKNIGGFEVGDIVTFTITSGGGAWVLRSWNNSRPVNFILEDFEAFVGTQIVSYKVSGNNNDTALYSELD